MRIAFDVSPLSHERTGVNNYIRGSLAGLADVARPLGHQIIAFAPTSPAGKRVIRRALAFARRKIDGGASAALCKRRREQREIDAQAPVALESVEPVVPP